MTVADATAALRKAGLVVGTTTEDYSDSIESVLAGARSLTAIWEHTTDLTGADLRSLGLEEGQEIGRAHV